jgi:hypothetical protein
METGWSKEELKRQTALDSRSVDAALIEVSTQGLKADIEARLEKAILSDKGPALHAIANMSIAATLEWLQNFITHKRHLSMTVIDANHFTNIMRKFYELSRIEAGKNISTVEILHKSSKDITVVLEKLASAKPEDGGDPFLDYPSTGGVNDA